MSDHSLSGYTPSSKTVWESRPGTVCQVRVLHSPPSGHKDNCGLLTTKISDPEKAAEYYRKVKQLPDDWPVQVAVVTNGKRVEEWTLPKPVEPVDTPDEAAPDQEPVTPAEADET